MAALQSERGNSDSSAVDSGDELDSNNGSYRVKRFDSTDEDFFFSEIGLELKETTNLEIVHHSYWDHLFNDEFSFTKTRFTGDSRFNFKLQKRYPQSKMKFKSQRDMTALENHFEKLEKEPKLLKPKLLEPKLHEIKLQKNPYSF
jgi:hypothetical protein